MNGRVLQGFLWVLLLLPLCACSNEESTTDPGGTTDVPVLDLPSALGTTDPGTVDPGVPDPGPVDPGTPDPGQADPGTPDPGTPDPGIPDEGQSDPGEYDPGTQDPGTPDEGTLDTATDPGVEDPGPPGPVQTFPTSLHATVRGMRTVYEEGYLALTEVPYDTPNLGCGNCHAPAIQNLPRRCESCHLVPGEKVADSTCIGCHSRQKTSAAIGLYPDVHLQAGMHCMDCHSTREMHGDGTEYASMWDEGATDTRCENCHQKPDSVSHQVHGDKLDCTACHVKSAVSCFSCHFDSQVDQGKKIHAGALHGWTFLVNRNGKVRSGGFQSLTFRNANRYVRWAPFHDHTVTAQPRQCGDCHNNAAVQEYKANGTIRLTWWDPDAPEGQPKLKNLQGVIPVVAGKMRFQFMVNDGTSWVPMSEGVVAPDQETFWSCSGLTDAQMTKLGMSIE